MASNEEIKVIITGEDKASGVLNNVGKSASGLSGTLGTLGKVAGVAAVAGLGALVGVAVSSIKEFNKAELAQTRLTQILRTATGATDAQIQSLTNQAEALEKVGVVSADVIKQGQGQLASFDLQAESIEKLIPSILNYAVAEKGLSMSGEELQAVTNGLAQAMNGNFASLTKTGFVLDDVTRKMISTGTETEKVEAISRVLDSTYGGLNERMRETSAGAIAGMGFAFDNLKVQIGGVLAEALTPFIEQLTVWAQDPATQEQLKGIAEGFANFMTQMQPVVEKMLPAFIQIMEIAGTAILGVSKFLFVDLPDALGTAIFHIDSTIKKIDEFINKINQAIDRLKSLLGMEGGTSIQKSVGKSLVKNLGNMILPGVGSFAEGGMVPGPVGSPQLAVVHGGEEVIPVGGRGGNITINITGTFLSQEAARAMANLMMQELKFEMRV